MKQMTVAELKAVCDQKGISYTSRTTKIELITLLEGDKVEAKVGQSFVGEY